tara:strand:+ start:169 stop:390 length:222 start_codon:yes stop_codon:yes gene_type:complete
VIVVCVVAAFCVGSQLEQELRPKTALCSLCLNINDNVLTESTKNLVVVKMYFLKRITAMPNWRCFGWKRDKKH